jgi:hypothetical protein
VEPDQDWIVRDVLAPRAEKKGVRGGGAGSGIRPRRPCTRHQAWCGRDHAGDPAVVFIKVDGRAIVDDEDMLGLPAWAVDFPRWANTEASACYWTSKTACTACWASVHSMVVGKQEKFKADRHLIRGKPGTFYRWKPPLIDEPKFLRRKHRNRGSII